ncbi:Glycosyltransferase, catalytic subunit of cellulose synthase and poly-beta-1,6-N-acetylglucosamine synthase [Gracilibacillus ureilyticus]|uniref:Glycosyltransferase, catalytic subunit of cellulose synthase and poly-beta-1,6-N-acetylglucosamine synthase n=1 Tax=Gracilibacillus ureilyticus TaxID=531814 RepID=A0A1H9R661_9BACI|nr:glycosyltransferase family 2 protein [Gracilibacillus ureilyticus]SER68015.1 Glycosyltransferase, catalytic subunit of cellulose synthase and poly-beta-1,6-N-acetylglucosamine synthase [Gracilibacillus ureilyticus]
MLMATLIVFGLYVMIQIAYLFYPLFSVKKSENSVRLDKEKGISVIIPAFNEEQIILNSLQGIINLKYSNYEVIFVNDGSSDNTLSLLHSHLDLQPVELVPASKISHNEINQIYQSGISPKIYLIDKENGGKADALNAGIEYASKELIVTLDADSMLDPLSLCEVNSAFQKETVIAGGGLVQITQGFTGNFLYLRPSFKTKGIIRYQILQYLTAFYLHKMTQSKLKSIIVIAGAFGAFRKQVLFDVNGYRKTVGEDMDITLKIHRLIKTTRKYRKSTLAFIPRAICYTECPSTLKELVQQRIRWQKGFIDCVIHFRRDFFQKLGFRVSFMLLFEYLLLGTLNAFPTAMIPIMLLIYPDNYMVAVALFSTTAFLSIYQGFITLIVAARFGSKYSFKQLIKVLLFIPVETITYRLLGLVFVISGTIMYMVNKNSWHVTKRTGQNTVAPPNPVPAETSNSHVI